jgi:hypothetical protein
MRREKTIKPETRANSIKVAPLSADALALISLFLTILFKF